MARVGTGFEGGTAESGFTIRCKRGGVLLEMELRGYWSVDVARAYLADIRSLWETSAVTRIAVVDVRQSPIQSTEVASLRSEIIGEAIRRGLVCIAYLTQNTLAKMQMRRISLEGGCREVECFEDAPAAREWVDRMLTSGSAAT